MDNYDSYDYYGESGCCYTCPEQEEGCLCFECRCTHCERYRMYEHEEGGYCQITADREDNWSSVSIRLDAWLKETMKAHLIVINGRYVWVPKSLVKIHSLDKKDFAIMPKWLAVAKKVYAERRSTREANKDIAIRYTQSA